jgi:hypothetical protein
MPRRSPPPSNLKFRPSLAARRLREQDLVGGPLPPIYKAKRLERARSWVRARQQQAALVDFLAATVLFIGGSYLATTLGASTAPQIAAASSSPPLRPVIQDLRDAIIGQESFGEHRTLNWDGSGALGLGQVMPENLPEWSEECLGSTLSPEEFLANHSLQVQLIDCKLSEFWTEEQIASAGDEDLAVRRVASRWYSGRADLYDSTAPQAWAGTPYPTIQTYTSAVLVKYRLARSAKM